MDTASRLSRRPGLAGIVIAAVLLSSIISGAKGDSDDEPIVLSEASGFHRATSEEEMAPIFKENLQADFAPWLGRKYSVRQLYELVTSLLKGRPQKYLSLVVVRKGRINFLPLTTKPMGLTMKRMQAIVSGLRNGTRDGVTYLDTVFLMNVWDEGRCYRDDDPRHRRAPRCTLPLFSLIKSWDYANRSSKETDVLLPFFNHAYGNLVFYPWEKKLDKALMRAAVQANMRPNSTRLWILQLQKQDPYGQRVLDAGITNNLSKNMKIQLANFVTIPEHARWKYLVSADGFTASCRLGKVLGTNSVVLKETTHWIEYYYRSLKSNVHYVPFNKDNVLQVLKSLEADPARCQKIAGEAQQFTYTFLSQHSKALYVKRTIDVYNGLVSDMVYFMESLNNSLDKETGAAAAGLDADDIGGLTLVRLLDEMKRFSDLYGGVTGNRAAGSQ